MRTSRITTVVTSCLMLLACGEGGRRIGPPAVEEPRLPPAPASVIVSNYNWSRIDVYARIAGQRVRLGFVETGQTESFTLPPIITAASSLELLVDPLASDAEYRTGSITVVPGAVLELRVENNLALSAYTIRGT